MEDGSICKLQQRINTRTLRGTTETEILINMLFESQKLLLQAAYRIEERAEFKRDVDLATSLRQMVDKIKDVIK
jgi:hypothetical protein